MARRAVSIGIRVDQDLRKGAERAAEADQRAFASLGEKLLIEQTTKHGVTVHRVLAGG
jgi:hypothetical protein